LRVIEAALDRIEPSINNRVGGPELQFEFDTLKKAFELLHGAPRPEPEPSKGSLLRPFPERCDGNLKPV
jgi:hypothetical protein